jgi:hypothetical protein
MSNICSKLTNNDRYYIDYREESTLLMKIVLNYGKQVYKFVDVRTLFTYLGAHI